MNKKQDLTDAVDSLIEISDRLSNIYDELKAVNKTLQSMPWGQLNGALMEIVKELRKKTEAQITKKGVYRQ